MIQLFVNYLVSSLAITNQVTTPYSKKEKKDNLFLQI